MSNPITYIIQYFGLNKVEMSELLKHCAISFSYMQLSNGCNRIVHVHCISASGKKKGYEFLQQSGVERVPYHRVAQDCQLKEMLLNK